MCDAAPGFSDRLFSVTDDAPEIPIVPEVNATCGKQPLLFVLAVQYAVTLLLQPVQAPADSMWK